MRILLVVATVLAAGCLAPGTPPPPPTPLADGALALESPAFEDAGAIPVEHTCDGANRSPPLHATGAPGNASTLALLVLDHDVPTPQTRLRDITHWLVWDVPLRDGEATFPAGGVPQGALQDAEWRGPCPPPLSPAHRYVFYLHAVQGTLDLPAGANRTQVETALEGRSVATTTLTGLYARAVPPG